MLIVRVNGSLAVLRELVNQVALDNPGFTLKMEVEFFCGDFEQSIQTVKANCGADIFDKNPKDFSETIRSSSDSIPQLHLNIVNRNDAVHAHIASSHGNIGIVYNNMGEYSKALEYYRKGLEMQLAVYGSDAVHAAIDTSYKNNGNVYRHG
ncbi:hypothetical protein EB796_004144 [Bugula neritina]|uniref:Uncharacterized protein n=1 Tax=Bugula neritina TaxID=10212 RepID=A0A7J7KIU2_BUGNE|nr:hypothetical protein EB796_004144 [Bugula neritina]